MTLGSYQTRDYSLANGDRLLLETDADQVLVTELSASDGVTVRFNDGPDGAIFRGLEARGPIRKVEVFNGNGAAITLSLATAKGLQMVDRRVSVVGDAAAVEVEGAPTLTSQADVTVAATSSAQILAADTTRREALIQNLDGSTTVRIADSNVAAARGLELAPGDVLILATQGAVHCHNPSGAGVDIAALSLTG